MSAAFKDEETLKAELGALTAASRHLREELENDLAVPEIERHRALYPHSSIVTKPERTSDPADNGENASARLRLKAREVRARAARNLMKSRSTRERAERFVKRAARHKTR